MNTVKGWTTRRSSASMTIIGRDSNDQVVKIAHVTLIETGQGCAIATDINGLKYQLLCDGAAGLADIAPEACANAVAA